MVKSQQSDALLINKYISGDESALEMLVSKHQARLFGFIYSKVNDKDIANDYFQETFIKVINTLKTQKYYDEKGKFLPWIMRIANNLIVDDYRKNNKVKIYRDTEDYSIFSLLKDDSQASIDLLYEKENVASQIKKLINDLPSDQKEVLVLRYFHDLSFREISEVTNVSLNTSLGRMRYAISNLKKLVEKNNISITI